LGIISLLKEDFKRNTGLLTKIMIFTYRFGNWIYYDFKIPILKSTLWIFYKIMNFIFFTALNNCEIPAKVQIGKGLRIGHNGRCVVIHPNCILGENVTILHEVTVGTTFTDGQHGVPNIGNNVLLGVGSKLLGKLSIGDNVKIGANAVVTKDIPSNCVAVGIPAKPIKPMVKVLGGMR
jgi:serine O-acetyltransferase